MCGGAGRPASLPRPWRNWTDPYIEKMDDVLAVYEKPYNPALEILQGKVIGQCYQRHRHQEFLKFMRTLDQEFPGQVPLHLIMDNYGTHKHENVRAWLRV